MRKVQEHWTWHSQEHWTWHSLLSQLLQMLLLLVLQVRLGCLLWGAEGAEVVVVAGWCLALSLEPAMVWKYPLEAGLVIFPV